MRSECLRKCEFDSLPFPEFDNFLPSFIALYSEPSVSQTRWTHGTFLFAMRNGSTLAVQVLRPSAVSEKGACET